MVLVGGGMGVCVYVYMIAHLLVLGGNPNSPGELYAGSSC